MEQICRVCDFPVQQSFLGTALQVDTARHYTMVATIQFGQPPQKALC